MELGNSRHIDHEMGRIINVWRTKSGHSMRKETPDQKIVWQRNSSSRRVSWDSYREFVILQILYKTRSIKYSKRESNRTQHKRCPVQDESELARPFPSFFEEIFSKRNSCYEIGAQNSDQKK